jgi:hypothetical protein
MFVDIEVDPTSSFANLAGNLRAIGPHVQRHGGALVRHNAELLKEAVKAHASGRPGPEVRRDVYRQSIKVRAGGIAGNTYSSRAGRISGGWEAEVYTNEPYARRLEFGFVGADSRGRHYNQPPYPHWGPAAMEVEPLFALSVERLIDTAIALKAYR